MSLIIYETFFSGIFGKIRISGSSEYLRELFMKIYESNIHVEI